MVLCKDCKFYDAYRLHFGGEHPRYSKCAHKDAKRSVVDGSLSEFCINRNETGNCVDYKKLKHTTNIKPKVSFVQYIINKFA